MESPSSTHTSLFRVRALESVCGHDNLYQTIDLVGAMDWFIFLFGGGLIGALALWLYLGSITTTVQVEGVVQQMNADGAPESALLLVPMREGNNIEEGMAVSLSEGLLYSSSSRSYSGKVKSISKAPLLIDDVDSFIDVEVVKYLFKNGPCFRVVVSMENAPVNNEIVSGLLHGEVTIRQYKPIELITAVLGGAEK